MTRKWVIAISITGLIMAAGIYIFLTHVKQIDLSETQKLIINFEHTERKSVHTEVTDPKDFEDLIRICEGTAINDYPSCGFGAVELVFESEKETQKIYPACDTCETMRFGEENTFFYAIESDERAELESILKKYGIEFPCF